ncbi:unnamed protein product [Prorocentrum cordatum]|uniref:Uncharacterized protein n=1 Tax=Prorocentrum cordatum TaxID=2364126 RepID=A0ABN9VCW6_9DINO|nr:unnamed protein product [Polarella glacialis]
MGCCCSSKSAEEAEDLHQPKTRSSGGKADAGLVAKKVEQAKKTGALALRECGLKKLPPSALDDGVGSFRTVDVTGNLLKELPDGLGAWVGLQNLLCARNQLQSLPPSVGQLANLKKLVLTDNRLARLPQELAECGSLAILQLDNNRLGPTVGDVFPGSLQELDLSRNRLSELTRLVLAGNELRELPVSLAGAARLQFLDAADNLLVGVPSQLLEGTGLAELWLKGNPIRGVENGMSISFCFWQWPELEASSDSRLWPPRCPPFLLVLPPFFFRLLRGIYERFLMSVEGYPPDGGQSRLVVAPRRRSERFRRAVATRDGGRCRAVGGGNAPPTLFKRLGVAIRAFVVLDV